MFSQYKPITRKGFLSELCLKVCYLTNNHFKMVNSHPSMPHIDENLDINWKEFYRKVEEMLFAHAETTC